MKIDVQDNMYAGGDSSSSNSSVSSDISAASSTSHGSRVASDFLATLATSYTPSGNLVSSLDGLHSGVPTRTTPTLTPTTLRSIEQAFVDYTGDTGSHSREAGFVPPIIEPSQPTPAQTQNNIHLQQPQQQQQQQQIQPQQQQQHNNVLLEVQQTQLQAQQQQPQQQQQQQTRRNMGGRRPTRTVGMSPEEEERRQIRRERNKMAAARCRKRRLDHTNSLLEETEGLEQKKQSLQNEIAELQHAKDELEFMLEAHRAVCRLQSSSPPDVKPVIEKHPANVTTNNNNFQPEEFAEIPCNTGKQQQQHQQQQPSNEEMNGLRQMNRPNTLPIFTEPKPRPSSLHIKTVETPAFMKTAAEVVGVPITTPSSGIPFNFDSLMEGGTGLTPVSTPLIPSCSSQQRNNVVVSAVDLSSPDANPPKLVSL